MVTKPIDRQLQMFTIMQQLDTRHFTDWNAEELATLNLGALELGRTLTKRLVNAGVSIDSAYAIIHDKDNHEVVDPETGAVLKEDNAPHIHAVIRFDEGSTVSIAKAAKILGIAPQYIEPVNPGRHSWNNSIAYLTHIKYPGKYHYQAKDVATLVGVPYEEIYKQHGKAWLDQRAKAIREKTKTSQSYLEDLVIRGEITRSDLLRDSEMALIYGRNTSKFDNLMKAFGTRRGFLAKEAQRKGEFQTRTIFIYGKSGSGKSRLADRLEKEIIAQARITGNVRWEGYAGAPKNPFDDYTGEEIVLLDESRSAAMGASDWLNLLDPFRAGAVSARYQNKRDIAPRFVIVTNPQEPFQFFGLVAQKGDAEEAVDQFIRRLHRVVEVVGEHGENEEYRVYEIEKSPYSVNTDTIAASGKVRTLSHFYTLSNPKTLSRDECIAELAQLELSAPAVNNENALLAVANTPPIAVAPTEQEPESAEAQDTSTAHFIEKPVRYKKDKYAGQKSIFDLETVTPSSC